jgi:hypothetical protein
MTSISYKMNIWSGHHHKIPEKLLDENNFAKLNLELKTISTIVLGHIK